MKLRLAEIARRAGVSASTVSRVLNDRPGVNESTRLQVLTAIDVLGYERPERMRPRTGLVGVVVPELDNPFFPRIAQALDARLVHAGYTPVLCSESAGGIHEDDYVPMLLEHGVAGIVFVSGLHAVAGIATERYERLVDRGLPLVMVNGHVDGVRAGFVTNDDLVGMDLAVGHLASMGHTRIGAGLGPRRYTPVLRKEQGFREAVRRHLDASAGDGAPSDAARATAPPADAALDAAALDAAALDDAALDDAALDDTALDDLVSCTMFTVEGGVLAGSHLLDRGVTAIVCASDVMALGVVRAVRQRGLEVPGDVSVVGADDSVIAEFADPPLTTIRQPVLAMADAACRSLLDQIAGQPPVSGELLCQPELVVRSSSGRAPVTSR